MTELNDRFAHVGKVDVMEIGSTLAVNTTVYSNDTEFELDLLLLIFWRRICLVYKYKHNSEL